MELDITDFFSNVEPFCYSASVAELGEDAGSVTWENAIDKAGETSLLNTEEKREAFRDFVRSSGGWSDDEIEAWSNCELEALLIQWIAGDMREAGLHAGMTDDEWREYEQGCEEGLHSSRIYGGPLVVEAYRGRVFFSLD